MIQWRSSFIGNIQREENMNFPPPLVKNSQAFYEKWSTLCAPSFQISVRNLKLYLSWFITGGLFLTRSWAVAQEAAEGGLQAQNICRRWKAKLVWCQSFLIISILMFSCLTCNKSFVHSSHFCFVVTVQGSFVICCRGARTFDLHRLYYKLLITMAI